MASHEDFNEQVDHREEYEKEEEEEKEKEEGEIGVNSISDDKLEEKNDEKDRKEKKRGEKRRKLGSKQLAAAATTGKPVDYERLDHMEINSNMLSKQKSQASSLDHTNPQRSSYESSAPSTMSLCCYRLANSML